MKLLLTLDNNPVNNKIFKLEKDLQYDYEAELIKCCEHWRKNGGGLKDIEIIVDTDVNLIKNKKILDLENTKFINLKSEIDLESEYGFINVHKTGYEMQKLFPDEDFLHIDLDMYLQRELPDIFKDRVILGVYSEEDEKYQRKKIFGRLIETDFIYTPKNTSFYKEYVRNYKKVRNLLKAMRNIREYDIEEYVADYICKMNGYDLFERYEIGEGFYNKIDNPYFIHKHIIK